MWACNRWLNVKLCFWSQILAKINMAHCGGEFNSGRTPIIPIRFCAIMIRKLSNAFACVCMLWLCHSLHLSIFSTFFYHLFLIFFWVFLFFLALINVIEIIKREAIRKRRKRRNRHLEKWTKRKYHGQTIYRTKKMCTMSTRKSKGIN